MKIVIADASCLILFTNIGRLEILEALFEDLWITSEVESEYGLPLPFFVSVHDPLDSAKFRALSRLLDRGEASSIALAAENPGCRIIIDEKKGRGIAASMGLDVIGTLGLLVEAADRELLEGGQPLIDELDGAGFRLSPALKQRLLK